MILLLDLREGTSLSSIMLRVEWTVEVGLRKEQRDAASFLLDFIEGEQVLWGHILLLLFGLMIHVKLMITNLTLLTVNWHQLMAFGAQLFTSLAFQWSQHKHLRSLFGSILCGFLVPLSSITCANWTFGPSLLRLVARSTFPERPHSFLTWLLALSHSI